MSQTITPDRLLEERGTTRQLGAFVVAATYDRAGNCAFALGDGSLRIVGPDWQEVAAHDGAALSLVIDCGKTGWLSGGDDGKFLRIAIDGTVSEIARFGMKWVEHVAAHPDGKGVLACAVGKAIHIFDGAGGKLKTVQHPSSVTGLVFDPKGKRFAASH